MRGVKNRTENSLLLLNYDVFYREYLDNIIRGPQRTVQNNKKADPVPFKKKKKSPSTGRQW